MAKQKSLSRLLLLFFSISIAGLWSFTSLNLQDKTNPALDIWMLNVGQGESVLIREPSGKKILFDGGPNDSVLSELGSILPPWDRTIDLVILSHNHSDHIRGLISVFERYLVKELWISGAIHTTDDYRVFLQGVKDQKTSTKVVSYDSEACSEICPPLHPIGQTNFQIYHPLENMTGERPKNQHDATVIVKVSYGKESLLLTGDINTEHEEVLVKTCTLPKCDLSATALQVTHHGSADGSSNKFLKAVHPKIALIPVGLDNKFDHPRKETLDRLASFQIPIYRTDLNGRIHLKLDGKDLRLSCSNSNC